MRPQPAFRILAETLELISVSDLFGIQALAFLHFGKKLLGNLLLQRTHKPLDTARDGTQAISSILTYPRFV